jgi:hypothetical protein
MNAKSGTAKSRIIIRSCMADLNGIISPPYKLLFWRYRASELRAFIGSAGLTSSIVDCDITKWKYEIVVRVK